MSHGPVGSCLRSTAICQRPTDSPPNAVANPGSGRTVQTIHPGVHRPNVAMAHGVRTPRPKGLISMAFGSTFTDVIRERSNRTFVREPRQPMARGGSRRATRSPAIQ